MKEINDIIENLDPESKIGEISCRTQTCKKSSLIGLYEKQFNRMVQIYLATFIEIEKIKSLPEHPNQADSFKIKEEAKGIANSVDSAIKFEPTSDENIYDMHLTIEYGGGVAEQTSSINISKDSIVKVMQSFCVTACNELVKGKI